MDNNLVQVKAAALLAIRDALIVEDYNEAYHQLRLIADPECEHALAERNHWIKWETMAAQAAIDDLPCVSKEDGMKMRTGRPTPNDDRNLPDAAICGSGGGDL